MKAVSLENPWLFYLAIALSITPLWLVDYLPMVDLPQHVAQVAALRELMTGNPVFLQEFEVNWFTPYLMAYLLLYALSSVLSLSLATKLLVSIAVSAIPILTGALLREVGADERLRWLAIPGAISFAFYWGFLSFMCAVPLGLCLILGAMRYEKNPTVLRGLTIATLSVLLFFAHVLALGVASLVSLAYMLGRRQKKLSTLVRLWLPFTAALPLLVAWVISTLQQETFVQNAPVVYGLLSYRFMQLLGQPTGIDFFWPVLTPLVGLVLILAPVYLGCTITRDRRRWMLFLAGISVFLVFPAYAWRTAFLFERFGIFLMPLWVLLWDRAPGSPARLQWLPILAIVLIAAFNIVRFSAFNSETRDFTRIISSIGDGSRVASVVIKKKSPQFRHPVYLHQVAWYQSIGKGIVDFNFGVFYPQLVRFKSERVTLVDERFAWVPFSFQWDEFDGDIYDYFLFHTEGDIATKLFREHTSSVPLIAQHGDWRLYRNDKSSAVDEGPTGSHEPELIDMPD